MMGFRKTYQCSQSIAVLRGAMERAIEWSERYFFCQLDFLEASDSIRHEAVVRAMATRGVPDSLIAASLQDLPSSEVICRYADWKTGATAEHGLHTGVLALAFAGFKRSVYAKRGVGLNLEELVLQCAAWAGDMWSFATSAESLDSMVQVLERFVRDLLGLRLRHEKCRWAEARRDDQTAGNAETDFHDLASLKSMARLPHCSFMKVSGAQFQRNGGHGAEFDAVAQSAWPTYHPEAPFW